MLSQAKVQSLSKDASQKQANTKQRAKLSRHLSINERWEVMDDQIP